MKLVVKYNLLKNADNEEQSQLKNRLLKITTKNLAKNLNFPTGRTSAENLKCPSRRTLAKKNVLLSGF